MITNLLNLNEKAYPTSRRSFLVGACVIGAGLIASGLGPVRANAASAGTLTYGLSAYPPNLRPFEYTGNAAMTVKALLHRGLLAFDENGAVQPELAESWAQTDPRTYEFKLRANAKFQNGEPVTADDVKASFDAIRAEKSTAYARKYFESVASVDVIDPLTVRIVLKEPTPAFANVLATQYAPVVFGRQMDNPDAMIGCGPYRLESSEKGVSLTFKARTDFYRPDQPKTGTVRFVAYADDSLRMAALNAGDVDIIEYVPWQSMKRLSETPGLILQSEPGQFMYIVFNLKQGPFTDPRVRRAAAHAINREDVVKGAFFGTGQALDGIPIASTSPFYSEDFEHLWPYDPDRARSLLKEAGAENAKVTLLSSSTYGFHKDIAEILQQHFSAVGMQVNLALPEWGVRVSQGNEGKYHVAINGGSPDLGDPDDFTALFGSGSDSYRRSYGLSDPKIDELLSRGRHEANPQERAKIYTDLQRVVGEFTPVSFLNYRALGWGLGAWVKDFKILPAAGTNQVGMAFDAAYKA